MVDYFKKKVCMLLPNVFPAKTGGERYDKEMMLYLERMGYSVHYITQYTPPFFIRYGLTTSPYLIYHLGISPNSTIIVEDSAPHKRYLLANLFLKCFTNIKIVVIMHHPNFPFRKYKIFRFLDGVLQKMQLYLADHIVTNSEYTKKQILDMGISGDKITIISPAVDYTNKEFKEKDLNDPANILYLGYLTPRKGLIYLLRALSELKDYDWELFIGGDEKSHPDYVSNCKKFAKSSGIEDRVNFLGHIDRPQINELFRNADIFILPSSHESYGMVIKEASSFGVPIITTDVGAIPEIVKHEESALLIPPKDHTAISKAIIHLLEDDKLRKKIAKGGFNSVDFSYNWDVAGEKFYNLLLRLKLI
jgi:glycosyltransferase involved in cell wall biosynthesis